MKAKTCVVSVLMVSAFFLSDCGKASPTGPDITSKDKSISVQYIRVPPYDSSIGDIVILRWSSYPNLSGQASMTKTAEDNFNAGAQIKTEIKINMFVEDWRKVSEDFYRERKRLFIDGQELIFEGSEYGNVEFIYHNDGTIEITSPK